MNKSGKPRIAHLVSTFPPYRGGTGNVAFHFAKELSALDYEVVVYTPDYRRSSVQLDDIEVNFKIQRIKPWVKFGNAALVPQLLWSLSSFDIVHIHYPFFGGAEWAIFLKAFFVHPPKIVLTYHMDVIGDGFFKLFFKGYQKTILPLLVHQTDILMASTKEYALTSHISSYINKKKVFYEVPFGVSSHFFPSERSHDIMESLNIFPKDFVILFVGGLDRAHYFKGIPILIEAMAMLKRKDVRLLIVGNGNLIGVYQNEVNKKGLGSQVSFITGVTDNELPKYYNLSNAVVLPSINRSEAFGLVLLEAMACGKPVIGSRLPGVSTLIEEKKNGLLAQPGNARDLMEKIKFLVDHKEVGKTYGLNGFKKVEEQLRWNHIIKHLEKIYNEVLTY